MGSLFHKQIGLRDYSVAVVDRGGPAVIDLDAGQVTVDRNARIGDLLDAISVAQSHEQPASASLPVTDVDE